MKRRKTRVMPALLSLAMVATSVPVNVLASPLVRVVSDEDDQMQMVSDKSLVYVSSYDGSVRSQNFNDNWKFNLGDVGSAQSTGFDDSKWRQISLPHDYSIEQEYSKNMEAESGYLPGGVGWYRKNFTVPMEAANKQIRIDFDGVYMNSTVYINGTELGTHPYGYSPFSFDLTPYINFGGENVIAVKVNHQTPSSRWYSGSGIYRDVKLTMTPMIHEGINGTRVTTPDLEENASNTATVHLETEIQNESANASEVHVSYKIYKKGDEQKAVVASGQAEAINLASGKTATVTADLSVDHPDLWGVGDPNLYVVETTISGADGSADVTASDFGFRYFEFDTKSGFYLNGEPLKLKGVCMHHDQGSLGSEAWHRAIERQVETLQEMGCNAIRVTHNPAAQALIDICNEKGMLVIEELFDGWHGAKNGNSHDYSEWWNKNIASANTILGQDPDTMTWPEFDLKSVLRRDYNAPSIISWSIGNEVMEGIGIGRTQYPEVAKKLIRWAQEVDTTRPITFGGNKLKENWAEEISIANSLTEAGGTVGFNYANINQLQSAHNAHPDWAIYGAETASSVNSRGVYNPSLFDRQLTSYDESCVGWGHKASQAWLYTIEKDFVAGEFVWTGFDYIGEPTNWNGVGSGAVGTWPSPKNSYFGIVDTAGFPKDSYYLYQSLWNEDVNTLHILPAWDGDVVKKDASGNVNVVVYSDAASVELFFTPEGSTEQKSLGVKNFTTIASKADDGSDGLYTYQMNLDGNGKETNHQNLYLTWSVPYADGTLSAVAKDADGNVIEDTIGRDHVSTTTEAVKLTAEADRDVIEADGEDLTYISVDVTDASGNMVPDAQNRVTFTVEGEGELVGVDNGWTTDHESYQADNRRAFNGKVLAIVRSTDEEGSFTVTASADGLESASVTVETVEADDETGNPDGIVSYEIAKNYYVKVGNAPVLPETLKANFADGTSKDVPVTWNDYNTENLEKEGTFVITGDLDGTQVSVSVSMIRQIAAILNYSTTVHTGEQPILPESREIVSEDGEILNISLPISWENVEDSRFDEEGIVTVHGAASVFGEEIPVTATVRVQKEVISLTDNVASKAKVTQNIPDELTSDTLSAITNGDTQSKEAQDSDNRNLSRWSNWNYTKDKNNDPPAELLFTYATQETLGQAKIYFVRDNASLRFPDAGATKWYISNDMEEWTELAVKETIAEKESSSYVTCYTYEFAPVKATYIKVEIHNSTEQLANGNKPSTGITEVELYRSEGKFVTNSTTGLSALTINGMEISESALANGSCKTPMTVVESIEAVGKDNASVTILPATEDEVRIITESEDHSKRETFLVTLGASAELTPDDPSMDYPREQLSVSDVSSEELVGDPGAADHVLDGDESSFWHTNWQNPSVDKGRYIVLKLEEETTLDAIRYLGRQGSHNGRVNEYKVEVSTDNTNWETVATGNWTNTTGWKMATFTEPVKAKYVRLTGVKTYGDQQNKFMTAAEIRVRMAKDTINLSEAEMTLDQERYTLNENGDPIKPVVTVTLDGTPLKYGIDYTLTYQNNDKPGIATVTVKGIVNYSGSIVKEFRIISDRTQSVTVEHGQITELDGEVYEGGNIAEVESGKHLTIVAETREGEVFDHWRSVPENVLSKSEKTSEIVEMMVPESNVRLVAVYREADKDSVTKEAYSTAYPADWFAYAPDEELDRLLDDVMDSSDEIALLRGAKIRLILDVAYSKSAPSKTQIASTYASLKATASNARLASASNADAAATPSEADAAERNPLDILNDGIISPLKAVREEIGLDEDSAARKTRKISFWLRTTARKELEMNGTTTSTQLLDDDLGTIPVHIELPKADRNMADYQILRYEYDGDETMVTTVDCNVEGNILTFEANVDGIYAVLYTKCFDVKFVDWDGTVLSTQRIAYGEAAEAPEDPEREGYVFVGWSKEFDEITSDLTIKAKYEKGSEAKKEQLEQEIGRVEGAIEELNPDDYTEASWEALEKALEKAQEVLDDAFATQKSVDKALANLKDAFQKLEKQKPTKPSRPSHSSGDSDSNSGSRTKAKTPQPLANGAYVTEGSWKQENGVWNFIIKSKEKAVSRWIYTLNGDAYDWFYFDANGKMVDGWIMLDGTWFYLNPISNGKRGVMATGWQLIDGNWYYFNPNSDGTRGAMQKGITTPDGYTLGNDGIWRQ